MKTEQKTRTRITRGLIVFMVLLIFSGITAFPLETELSFLLNHSKHLPANLKNWIEGVYDALNKTNNNYPFMAYGTDWLAFAHLVIAVAFIGPIKDPIRNIWVIQFGMIACMMVFPLAFIAGSIRGIPIFWQIIDCSFGVFGMIPLYLSYKNTIKLQHILKIY